MHVAFTPSYLAAFALSAWSIPRTRPARARTSSAFFFRIWLFTILTSLMMAGAWAAPVSRQVIALFDGVRHLDARSAPAHRYAELPLNYLGLVVHHWDIRQGLPDDSRLEQARGVLIWVDGWRVENPTEFFRWMSQRMDRGARVAWLGSPLDIRDGKGIGADAQAIDALTRRLGVQSQPNLIDVTYAARITFSDRTLIGFERNPTPPFPAFGIYDRLMPGATAHLSIATNESRRLISHVVVTGQYGGFVERGYALHEVLGSSARLWQIDPFMFFAKCFRVGDEPRPDPTTASGRRVFFSHAGGRGGGDMSDVFRYRRARIPAAQVIVQDILKPYPQRPIAVAAPVVAADPRMRARLAESLVVLRGLTHVSVAADFNSALVINASNTNKKTTVAGAVLQDDAVTIWDVEEPEFQLPPPATVTKPMLVGVARNLTWQPLSYTDLPPFSLPLEDGEAQWTATYGGLDLSVPNPAAAVNAALLKSEQPRRVRPYGLRFELGAGRAAAQLRRVSEALRKADTQALLPLMPRDYAAMVDGFNHCEVEPAQAGVWNLSRCAELTTMRFDRAARSGVDFERSIGVVGQRHTMGSLYVTLDSARAQTRIALKTITDMGVEPVEGRPYLLDSAWRLHDVQANATEVRFNAQGFGVGTMRWLFPGAGVVTANVRRDEQPLWSQSVTTGTRGEIEFSVPVDAAARAVAVALMWRPGDQASNKR